MDRNRSKCALAFVIAGLLAVGPAIADKPSWAGGDKGGKGEHRDNRENQNNDRRDHDEGSSRDNGRHSVNVGGHFSDQHRTIARGYYSEQFHNGHCPPGLAKKHNGCMPPGQARKWSVGRALPRDVVFYEVPPALIVQIGRPPSGYRYVRVAGDILLIALGTGMVMDAIQDLGRS
jgi:Ni/Co efflux regulator RcnB